MDKLTYSIEETAEVLGISRSLAYELIKDGTIPSIELRTKRVVPIQRLINWVNKEDEKELGD